ncbi:MAG: hypothetical protein IT184_08310 [Acidobacteria bacterium]|nr:hypothetical protein [Acidobacteriota bacterium]
MAKKRRAGALEYTAENIGAALGQLARRFDALKQQRAELNAELQHIVKSTRDIVVDGVSAAWSASLPTMATNRKGGRPKGYTVSDATRAKLRAAWERRRSEAQKKDAGSARDERAAIRKASGRKFSNRQRGKG